MKLSELIAAYGDDKIKFQNLDECAIDMNWSAKNGTTIKFGTSENLDLHSTKDCSFISCQGTEKLGLVVWFDRDELKQIIGDK